jgi:hypothetical protein
VLWREQQAPIAYFVKGMVMCKYAFLVLAAGGTALLGQSVYYLPEIMDGPLGSAVARTAVVLVNSNSADATVTLNLTNPANLPSRVIVAGGGTAILRTDGSGSGSAGAATITSSLPVVVTEILSVSDSTGSLMAETALGDSDLFPEHIIAVDTTGNLNSGVALFNPGTAAVGLTFSLFDTAGNPAGSPVTQSLEAGAQTSRLVAGDLFGSLPTGFQGTLVVTSDVPLPAVALRLNSGGPGLELLPPTPRSSGKYLFYVPQFADGPLGSAVLKTSLQFFNISSQPANVTVAFKRDDGSTFPVTIPGLGLNDHLSAQLAAGSSLFWQTDGTGPGWTGVAVIRADRPIGVSAFQTFSDSSGNFVNETVLNPPRATACSIAPVEIGADDNQLAVFNPELHDTVVALSLRGADGKPAGTAKLPVAAGAQATASLTSLFSPANPFAGSVSLCGGQGTLVVPVLLRRFTEAPAASQPMPVNPLNVTPSMDTKHAANATIGVAGGKLAATGADGTKFTLTVPAGALIGDTGITMTPVASVAGMPASATFGAAAQLSPEGLRFVLPATLSIQPAKPVPASSYLLPIGWTGAGNDVTLRPSLGGKTSINIPITHFSGGGYSSGDASALNSLMSAYGSEGDSIGNQIAQTISQARQDGKSMDDPQVQQQLTQLLDLLYHDVIEPTLRTALGSRNRTMMLCAIQKGLQYEADRSLVVGGSGSPLDGLAGPLILQLANSIFAMDLTRCANHEIQTAQLVLQDGRMLTFLTGNDYSNQSTQAAQACLQAAFQLNFTSRIWGTFGGIEFDSTVHSDVKANFKLNPDQGHENEMVPFDVGAQAPLVYQSFKVKQPDEICTVSTSTKDSQFNLMPAGNSSTRSKLVYDVNLKGNPNDSSASADGKPVFCKAEPPYPNITDITMLIDVNKPTELLSIACPGDPVPAMPMALWAAGWATLHDKEKGPGQGPMYYIIQNWEISNGDDYDQTYARKTYGTDMDLGSGDNLHELSLLELHPTAYQPPK